MQQGLRLQALFLGGYGLLLGLVATAAALNVRFAHVSLRRKRASYALARLSRSISAYAEWLWMDSKFSASTT